MPLCSKSMQLCNFCHDHCHFMCNERNWHIIEFKLWIYTIYKCQRGRGLQTEICQQIEHIYHSALGVNTLKCIMPFPVPNGIYTAWNSLLSGLNRIHCNRHLFANHRTLTTRAQALIGGALVQRLHVSICTVVRHHANCSPMVHCRVCIPIAFPKYLERGDKHAQLDSQSYGRQMNPNLQP